MSIAKIGETDLWTTSPNIADLLENPNDGFSCSAVSMVCRGKLNKHKNHHFKYIS